MQSWRGFTGVPTCKGKSVYAKRKNTGCLEKLYFFYSYFHAL
ncbi:hypothetical protein FLA_2930 [Filimonas lacunae]|nr:hypothetical protein FLA_2930 [Filimonas lacunae]